MILRQHELLNQTDFAQSIHFLNDVTMKMLIAAIEGLTKRFIKEMRIIKRLQI